jgi:multidrug efflux pump subunit AcrA (membrane-fusion protein)
MKKMITVCLATAVFFVVSGLALANPTSSTTSATGSAIPNGLAQKQLKQMEEQLERSRSSFQEAEATYKAYEAENASDPAKMEELAQIKAKLSEANCADESLFLKAQGKGRILVRVIHRGQVVPIGGLSDQVTVKIMTVKEVYMDAHDQGGLVVLGGKKHLVQVSMTGRETVKTRVFVPVGGTVIAEVELGPKMKVKAPVSKKTQECSASVADTTRQVQQPFIPKTSRTVEVPAPVECTSGDCYYLNLPVGTK